MGPGWKDNPDVSCLPCTTPAHRPPLPTLGPQICRQQDLFPRTAESTRPLRMQSGQKRALRSRVLSFLEVVTFQGVGRGEWDEGAMQDIPAPPSPRPSGCVLMPPHSRLSQSSGFSLSAGGSPNSALYACSRAKLRIVIKYYHNAFSLYCLVLLLALVS